MRRLVGRPISSAVCLVLLLIAPSACKRKKSSTHVIVDESAELVSVVDVTDPAASAQLVRGFYPLEGNAWRWTMPRFTVALKSPPGAAQNGGRLSLKFNVPTAVVDKLGPITLRATINGLPLQPDTYSKSGNYVYVRDVPASALRGNAVSVDFVCDKSLPPTGDDARELALVVTSIGIESK